MLVLSRKRGESIVIGDNILVTVVEIDGGHIRLGIKAPREFPVARSELIYGFKNVAQGVPKKDDADK